MTPKQFSEAITALGISQAGAGLLLGVTGKSIRRWADGEQNIPRAVAVALALMVRFKVKPEQASKLAGYANKQAEFIDDRGWGKSWP